MCWQRPCDWSRPGGETRSGLSPPRAAITSHRSCKHPHAFAKTNKKRLPLLYLHERGGKITPQKIKPYSETQSRKNIPYVNVAAPCPCVVMEKTNKSNVSLVLWIKRQWCPNLVSPLKSTFLYAILPTYLSLCLSLSLSLDKTISKSDME